MIKVRFLKDERTIPDYPWIGVDSSGLIILFFSEGEGTVLESGMSSWKVGAHNENWIMKAFYPITTPIVLENK